MEAQKGYLYTCNEKYRELTDSVENLKETKKKSKGNDAVFIEHLKQKIDIYFEVILQTLRDSIPKAIGFFLIKESQVCFYHILLKVILNKFDRKN